MKKKNLLLQIGLVVLTAVFATAAFAGPIVTVVPDMAGPISCSDATTLLVHYNPNDYAGELWGFEITLANGASDFITFDDSNGSADVSIVDWAGGIFGSESDAPYEIAVSGAVIGGTALADSTEADLFSITLHGAATGMGELNITKIVLLDSSFSPIAADVVVNPAASIDVDCTPPDAPVMVPEPAFTAGLENTVSWSMVMDAVEYNVTCSNGDSSGWIAGTSYTFMGLAHGTSYDYNVQARDNVGNEGVFSATVSSTQDNVTPESAAGPLGAAYGLFTFDVPWTASDDLSGVSHVQLMYQVDGGGYMTYGTTYATSPIAFDATVDGDGVYDFYTIATDNAGNLEVDPELDGVSTIVDTTPPDAPVLVPEPAFTQGASNTLDWAAVVGATEYRIFYGPSGTDSGWITALTWTFTPLADGSTFNYTVQARDALGNEGPLAAVESSTQDDSDPESNITNPASGNMLSQTFNIDVFSTDPSPGLPSGVSMVRLFYNLNSTTWVQFGSGFASSPIAFTAPGDGSYEFYTIAEDNVGNVEAAPAVADINLLVDTGGPTGTFVINDDDAYATDTAVTLNSNFTDANGVTQMRFTNVMGDYSAPESAWQAYADSVAWDLMAGDGVKTVYAEYEDGTTNVSATSDDIELDTTAPLPVAVPWSMGLVAGHESIIVNWTEDNTAGDLASVEIWVSLWDDVQDSVGVTTYPEYNDTPAWPAGGSGMAGVLPTVADHLDPDADWALLATVPVGTMTFTHAEGSPWTRGAYSYYLFAKDNAGNYSDANSEWTRRSVNYVLGDFNDDGVIAIGADVSPFAGAYGANEGHPAYNNIFDIGPVAGGVPDTDNDIDFEDLMILSINFNSQAKGKPAVGDPQTPVLTWYQADELNWVLGLSEASNSLKGLRLVHALPENATAKIAMGADLQGTGGYFLANGDAKGLDLGFAVLGRDLVMPGSGEILRVTTSEPLDLTKVTIEVRDANNETIEFELKAEPMVMLPTAYALHNNYPNPFNPETTIKFALPEAQDVKLEIFDIKGYRVRVLLSESMSAGTHSVVWNGRDEGGRNVASGTYFYRIQSGPLNQTHRMLLLK